MGRSSLMTQGLTFVPEDTAAQRLSKLEVRLGALASAEDVALLADFLGLRPPTRLQLNPELQRRKTIDLLARWNLALSAHPLFQEPVSVYVMPVDTFSARAEKAATAVFSEKGG